MNLFPTPLMRLAADVFGVDPDAPDVLRPPDVEPPVAEAGKIVLFNGPSGGGKTTALRRHADAAREAGWHVVDVGRLRLKPVACVEQFGKSGDDERDFAFAASRLNQVGLGEVRVMLRPPSRLSDGQRWRLRVAVAVFGVLRRHALAKKAKRPGVPELLVIDEFCAVLDRVAGPVVARSLRQTIDRVSRVGAPLAAAVATSHDDLRPALRPDHIVWCES